VESLKARHFPMLNASAEARQLQWLQTMLLRGWIARAEEHLPNLLPARHPCCLVAIEQNQLLALVVARPYNRRGSCWSVTMPELLATPGEYSLRRVRHDLLQSALQLGSNRAKSWVLRCPASDADQLALTRELGFQPLKLFQFWTAPLAETQSPQTQHASPSDLPGDLSWQQITHRTANLLWPLEQAGGSGHLRQIVDRQSIDLLDQSQDGTGVMLCHSGGFDKAIAGLVSRPESEQRPVLELLRDVGWDPRLTKALPIILSHAIKPSLQAKLLTASEDEPLNQLLDQLGWQPAGEEMLLGRSLWRRQMNSKLIPGTRPLESMLGRLRPQRPPLPTPSLGRR